MRLFRDLSCYCGGSLGENKGSFNSLVLVIWGLQSSSIERTFNPSKTLIHYPAFLHFVHIYIYINVNVEFGSCAILLSLLIQWLRKWIKKCDDDSETSNWIAANTKVSCYIGFDVDLSVSSDPEG